MSECLEGLHGAEQSAALPPHPIAGELADCFDPLQSSANAEWTDMSADLDGDGDPPP
jgi:hypothetical protein